MGNVMLCGNMCDSVNVQKQQQDEDKKFFLENILLKEATYLEKMEKYVSKEIGNVAKDIEMLKSNIYETMKNKNTILNKEFKNIDGRIDDDNSKINTINNRLNDIEKNISSINTIKERILDDIKELKHSINALSIKVVENSTRINSF